MTPNPLKSIRRLLVVDDDNSVRLSLRRLLESEHFAVETAAAIPDALNILQSKRIDLVVLDLNLAGENGWDLFREITALDSFIPVVIVTGEWGQHEKAVELGAEALLEKPIDVPVFLETLRTLLALNRTGRGRRLPGCTEYCRFVPRHYEPFLRLLQDREHTPLEIETPAMVEAEPNHG